ncbi:hypothetical protein OUZ56_025178 [Daphnia magna]|uniref:Uncharacterized protein n=1 Tax=Daphnia magna TaxID=35525 RepID=A0ABQ9ZJ24_9CRUS|nr:hypothetical protein OUZ56_025178 [Daphnia magna]
MAMKNMPLVRSAALNLPAFTPDRARHQDGDTRHITDEQKKKEEKTPWRGMASLYRVQTGKKNLVHSIRFPSSPPSCIFLHVYKQIVNGDRRY